MGQVLSNCTPQMLPRMNLEVEFKFRKMTGDDLTNGKNMCVGEHLWTRAQVDVANTVVTLTEFTSVIQNTFTDQIRSDTPLQIFYEVIEKVGPVTHSKFVLLTPTSSITKMLRKSNSIFVLQ